LMSPVSSSMQFVASMQAHPFVTAMLSNVSASRDASAKSDSIKTEPIGRVVTKSETQP
jgi:hypothetical protein